MSSNSEVKMSQNIASFVFFDIETTGLPAQERNQTKIIEFSFVAALRKDLEDTRYGDIPPVSKLTFLLNPRRSIHPEVTKMTGLSNKILIHAPHFKQKINSMISFLEDLPKPVCLVAHNGNCFDYKILLAEFKDAGAVLPEDLLCVDSLVGFRKILNGKNINFLTLSTNQLPIAKTEDLLTDDEDDWPDLNLSTEEWEQIDDLCVSVSDISCEDLSEGEENKEKIKKARSEAIKSVFSNKPIDKRPKKVKTKVYIDKSSYKLIDLYKRLLNREEANAHRAEADCLMLIQCVVALKDMFLPWADISCKMLGEIKPLVRY